jgi:hypothetical protein
MIWIKGLFNKIEIFWRKFERVSLLVLGEGYACRKAGDKHGLEKNAGWSFWVREGERVRFFVVADVNLSAAEDTALAETNYGIAIEHQEIGEEVIELLKLPYGKVMEWTRESGG